MQAERDSLAASGASSMTTINRRVFTYRHSTVDSGLTTPSSSISNKRMSAPSVHADAPPELVVDPEGLQYETGPQLGKGGFAICHRAKLLGHEHLGNTTVALKIVKSKMEPPKLAQKVKANAYQNTTGLTFEVRDRTADTF